MAKIVKSSKAAERRLRREKIEALGIARAYNASPHVGIGAWRTYNDLLGKVYREAVKGDPRAIAAVENWPQQPVSVTKAASDEDEERAKFRAALERAGVRL